MTHSDALEWAYFFVGMMFALPPAVVFGWIGFIAIRQYFRDQARKAAPIGGAQG